MNFGGSERDFGRSLVQTSDGGFAVAGYSESSDGDVGGNTGFEDLWVIKVDSSGNLQWEENFGVNSNDGANSIIRTSDSGLAVAGYRGYTSGGMGNKDYWVIKLDSSGNLQWDRVFGGSSAEKANSLVQTSDGGFAVAGFTSSSNFDVSINHGAYDYWVIKVDSSGNLQWEENFGGNSDDVASSIIRTSDGGFAVAGSSKSSSHDVGGNNGGFDYWVIKLDSSGNLQWEENYGGSGYDKANSIIQTSDGGFAVAGYSWSSNGNVGGNNGGDDYWVIKLDSSGNLQWEENFGGSSDDGGLSLLQTSDGGLAVAGYSGSSDGDVGGNIGSDDLWVIKVDSSGNLQWEENFGGYSGDLVHSLVQTSDGGFAFGGSSQSSSEDVSGNNGGWDFWVLKLGDCSYPPSSSISPTACDSYVDPSGDSTYYSSGVYKDTVSFSWGCDSIITIDLTISNSSSENIAEKACYQYTVPSGDETYSTSGVYEDTITNSAGCDSLLTIDLTIDTVETSVTRKSPIKLEADQSVANYQWLDCDSSYSLINGATSQQFTASTNGNYAVEVTKNGCTDTSSCYAINSVGISENDLNSNIKFYPNPTNDRVTFEIPGRNKSLQVTVRNMNGKKVSERKLKNPSSFKVELGEKSGIYMVRLQDEEGKNAVIRVVKE